MLIPPSTFFTFWYLLQEKNSMPKSAKPISFCTKHLPSTSPTPSYALKQTIPSVDEVLEAFSVFDQNGNGYIALSELQHLMKNLGEGLSDDELAAMSAQAEPDDEGQINIRHIVTKLLAN